MSDPDDGEGSSDDEEGPNEGITSPDDGETTSGEDPFDALDEGAPAEDDPFEALAAGEAPAADAPGTDPFTEMEVGVGGVRPAAGDEASGSVAGEGSADAETDPDEHVVPTRSFCERCEHFAAPPRVACEHPGTEIREVVDVDHVLVANCPVVAERLDRTFDDD